MKLRFTLAIALIASLFLMSNSVVQPEWSALNSGYAVTTDYHGLPVYIPQDVTARAGTTDSDITSVKFRWIPPVGTEWTTGPFLLVDLGDTWNGDPIYEASNTQTIDILDDWGVQALFYDSNEPPNLMHETGVEKIRATSFFVIPEVPFGTIAIVLSMLGALSIFAIKKKVFVPKR